MNNVKSNEEKDLETLRREYRNMEVNRKTFAEESNTVSVNHFLHFTFLAKV